MRVFRTTYKARNGKTKEAQKWYLGFRDHLGYRPPSSGLRQRPRQGSTHRRRAWRFPKRAWRRVLAFCLALLERLL